MRSCLDFDVSREAEPAAAVGASGAPLRALV